MNKEAAYRNLLKCTNDYQTTNLGSYSNGIKYKWFYKRK